MLNYLLRPMGIESQPRDIKEAIASYREARNAAEKANRREVSRRLENAIAPLVFRKG